MMLSGGLVALVFLLYMALLFVIAFWGDRNASVLKPRLRVWIYSLSLSVWCTSWTFFGSVGMATNQLWGFCPSILAPCCCSCSVGACTRA
jgi:Na+/proline symporter